jgi:hypothetical protein
VVDMELAIVDGRMPDSMIANLKACGFAVEKTIEHSKLAKPVAYHPDMQMCRIDKHTIVICPELFNHYINKLEKYDLNLICGKSKLEHKYPLDIAYNCAVMRNKAFHRANFTDEIIKRELCKNNIELVNINQGYGKCSMAIIPDGSCICGDVGVGNVLRKEKIDYLEINPNSIILNGYDHGFIGGSSSQGSDKLYITGSLEYHDFEKSVREWIEAKGIELIELSDDIIVDYGTILIMGE